MVQFILLAFIVGILETILSGMWNRFYFKSGLVIYLKIYNVSLIPASIGNAEKIELLIPDSKYPKILFKKIDDNFFVFREKLFHFFKFCYTPIMHGNLIFDSVRGQLKVFGRTNWFPLVFTICILIVSFNLVHEPPFMLIMPALLTVIMLSIYIIQKKRFDLVASLIAENINNLNSSASLALQTD